MESILWKPYIYTNKTYKYSNINGNNIQNLWYYIILEIFILLKELTTNQYPIFNLLTNQFLNLKKCTNPFLNWVVDLHQGEEF